jgi:hypothetical protein
MVKNIDFSPKNLIEFSTVLIQPEMWSAMVHTKTGIPGKGFPVF